MQKAMLIYITICYVEFGLMVEDNPLNARPFSLGSNPYMCGINFMHDIF